VAPRPHGRDRRELRTTEAAIQQRRRRSVQQLILTIGALILLLLFWNQLSQGTAGCFAELSAPVGGQPPAAGPGPGTKAAPAEELEPPAVRVKLPPRPPAPAVQPDASRGD
jgi:hypothetical protein